MNLNQRAIIVVWLTWVWGILLSFSSGYGQTGRSPILAGESIRLHSAVLKEDRSILVYKPDGYSESTAAYPVLYLLDGEAHWLHTIGIVNHMSTLGLMPKMLVIGIVNTDRARDMTPSPKHGIDKNFPSGGGATPFLSFINQELKPYINAHFRTEPYSVLAGTSLSGLFVINTLLTQPASSNAYLAISPALWWDQQAVPLLADSVLVRPTTRNTFLYFTLCPDDSNVLQQSTQRLHDLLTKRTPDALSWEFRFIPDETHNSVVHLGLYFALKSLYNEWKLLQVESLASLDAHYARLSTTYGYPIAVPEEQVNSLGYQFLFGGKIALAIDVFKRNIAQFPKSSNAFDSMGDAYKTAGKLSLARSSYEKAYALGKAANSSNLASYRNNLDQINKLILQQPQSRE